MNKYCQILLAPEPRLEAELMAALNLELGMCKGTHWHVQ